MVAVEVAVLLADEDGSANARVMAMRDAPMKTLRWELCWAALAPAGFPGANVWADAA